MHRLSTLALITTVLWTPTVAADVVRPPPPDCPAGSVGVTGHSGPYCRLLRCTGNASCEKGMKCETRKLCVAQKSLSNRRQQVTIQVEQVLGSCDGGKKCPDGACTSVRVCVPKRK